MEKLASLQNLEKQNLKLQFQLASNIHRMPELNFLQ